VTKNPRRDAVHSDEVPERYFDWTATAEATPEGDMWKAMVDRAVAEAYVDAQYRYAEALQNIDELRSELGEA
jgi:hypothetical protein